VTLDGGDPVAEQRDPMGEHFRNLERRGWAHRVGRAERDGHTGNQTETRPNDRIHGVTPGATARYTAAMSSLARRPGVVR
jgi:hypothetical protein